MASGTDKLKRMKARLQGTAAEELPAPYSIKCDCGTKVEGTRNSTSKQTCCPDCLTELFLLPTNVYPSTASVPSDVISGGFTHRLTVVFKEDLLPRGRKASDAAPGTKKPSKNKTTDSSDTNDATQSIAATRRLRLPRVNPVRTIRRVLTPLRLLVVGMLLAIAATLGVMWHQNRVETARITWRDSGDAIPELLEQHEFHQLESVLVGAVEAGRILGENGPEWRHTVNLLEENRAIGSLAFSTLPVTMSEAGFSRQSAPADVDSVRALLMQGMFVVDGYIDPARSPHEFTLDIPVMPGQPNVTVLLELAELQEYIAGSETHRAVFAFRVSDVRQIQHASVNGWAVDVDPQSFVLFTSGVHCEQLGWSVSDDSELGQLLQHQLSFVERSAEWTQRHERIAQQQLAQAGE